jgi:hypothetical protein
MTPYQLLVAIGAKRPGKATVVAIDEDDIRRRMMALVRHDGEAVH